MTETKQKIYFRADANSQIGWGHVVRSMALADILIQENSKKNSTFECIFLVQNPSLVLQNQIKEKFELIILKETSNFLEEAYFITQNYLQTNLKHNSIIVLDHYQIQTEYQRVIKQNSNTKIVCIDDLHSWHFLADIIINHGGKIDTKKYSCEPYTKLLLGTQYALLRKPFLEAAKQKRKINKIETIFICFGGADIHNLTEKSLELVLNFEFIKKINVVITGDSYSKELHNLVSKNSSICLYQNLDAQQVANLMQDSDLAFAPASSLSLELLATQPFVILGQSADNQATIYQELISYPQLKGIGEWQNLNWKQLKEDFFPLCTQFCLETSPIIPNLAPSKIKQAFENL